MTTTSSSSVSSSSAPLMVNNIAALLVLGSAASLLGVTFFGWQNADYRHGQGHHNLLISFASLCLVLLRRGWLLPHYPNNHEKSFVSCPILVLPWKWCWSAYNPYQVSRMLILVAVPSFIYAFVILRMMVDAVLITNQDDDDDESAAASSNPWIDLVTQASLLLILLLATSAGLLALAGERRPLRYPEDQMTYRAARGYAQEEQGRALAVLAMGMGIFGVAHSIAYSQYRQEDGKEESDNNNNNGNNDNGQDPQDNNSRNSLVNDTPALFTISAILCFFAMMSILLFRGTAPDMPPLVLDEEEYFAMPLDDDDNGRNNGNSNSSNYANVPQEQRPNKSTATPTTTNPDDLINANTISTTTNNEPKTTATTTTTTVYHEML